MIVRQRSTRASIRHHIGVSRALGTIRYLDAETAIIDPHDRLLLIEQERPRGREWRLPGGGVEPGETVVEATVREAREETGLAVRVGRLVAVDEYWRDGELIGFRFIFLAEPDPPGQMVDLPAEDGAVRFLGHRWVARDELVTLEAIGPFDLCREAWPPDLLEPLLRRIELSGTPT
jgi:ADP-ribose pyrophosphatase YjhB (NUDIX family)